MRSAVTSSGRPAPRATTYRRDATDRHGAERPGGPHLVGSGVIARDDQGGAEGLDDNPREGRGLIVGQHDRGVDPAVGQQLEGVVEGADARRTLRPVGATAVRLEHHDGRSGVQPGGGVGEVAQDLLVPEMHTVKMADRRRQWPPLTGSR